MSVRLKFKVTQVSQHEGGQGSVKLYPVTGGSEENKSFYQYTPGGSIEFSTVNAEAMKQFTPGQEYYIDLTPAPAPAT